jgi:microcystin degradation protein MlrC
MTARRKIAVGGIAIESCTFSPLVTRAEDFLEIRRGPDVLRRHPHLAHPPFAGRADVEWTGLFHARALPGGVVAREVYEGFKREILVRLDEVLPVDGFHLDLHGAMAVEGLDDPEADLATAVRARVGPRALVAASMDLHGNVSAALVEAIDLVTAYRTAPHEDVLATREKAARMLLDGLDRGTRPARAWCAIPVLLPGECTSTQAGPARTLYAQLADSEDAPGVLDASLWVGYVWADVPRATAAVVVTGTDPRVCAAEAERIAGRYWAARRDFVFHVPAGTADEVLDRALAAEGGPVFVSDSGDNPTAGGAGDVPYLLERLLARPAFCEGAASAVYASMPDSAAVAACVAAGEGAAVRALLGGKLDPVHGRPLAVEGIVERLVPGDAVGGDLAVLRCGGVRVILTQRRKPFHRIEDFTKLGLDPSAQKVVVVKIGYLEPELRAAARYAFLALTPGAVNQDVARLPYRRLTRPMFPMDRDFEWAPRARVFEPR